MNPWKLTTIGIALVTMTAFTTGLTTAYFMRPAASAEPDASLAPPAPPRVAQMAAPRMAAAQRAVAQYPSAAPHATSAPIRQVAASTRPADCSTGGERAMRIAKPGALGGLLGAGLGAVGGAIASGGKGAGKGALIGGLTGVAAGGAYGAYKTKNECGTIFGGGHSFQSPSTLSAAPIFTATQQSALTSQSSDGFTVYPVR